MAKSKVKTLHITAIEYERRFNTAKYEHEEIRVTASLDEGDDALEAIAALKTLVAEAQEAGAEPDDVETDEEEESSKKKKTSKRSKPSKDDDDDEEEEDEDAEEDTDEEDEEPESDEDEDGRDEGEDDGDSDESADSDDSGKRRGKSLKKSSKKDSKKSGPGKKKKSKAAPYDRGNQIHKKILGEYLRDEVKGYEEKQPEVMARTKAASEEMHGQDFLDDDGKMLFDFGLDFRKAMARADKKKSKK